MPLTTQIKDHFESFISLVYPRLCLSCQRPLMKNEELMCMLCKYDLPETNYHLDPENPVAKHFWGRIPIAHAAALYVFTGGSRVQELMHAFKYNNRPEVGIMLGKYYGMQLKDATPFSDTDVIVPVPLHPKKQHKRGYNQSAKFATGLAQGMHTQAANYAMTRISFTETQTRKNRQERWENVKKVFQVAQPLAIKDKNVLLVDDVVTTGSTLEACAQKIREAGARQISIATIACASTL